MMAALCAYRETHKSLGMRFWYAFGPWSATRLVAAIKQ